jgi:hypothetical protein
MAKTTIDLASPLAYTPAETAELICRAGVKKGRSRPDKVLLSGISGGCILAFGCAVSLTALTAPWYQENAPGLIKLIGAIVFPLGLVTVILTGADLFTSTNLVGCFMYQGLGTALSNGFLSSPLLLSSTEDYRYGGCYFTGSFASSVISVAVSLSWPSSSDVSNPVQHHFRVAF